MHSDFNEMHLKGFPAFDPIFSNDEIDFLGSVPELLRSVQDITSHEIRFIRYGGTLPPKPWELCPVEVGNDRVIGHLAYLNLAAKSEIEEIRAHGGQLQELEPPKSSIQTMRIIRAISELLGETYRWQIAVREREASFAAMDTPLPLPFASREFQRSLRNQLKIAVQTIRFDAASLYTLSSDTKNLKLRAVWGIPEERLLEPPRDLVDSYTDMEAMLGQAVVVNESYLLDFWKVPEPFPCAVCVPVSVPSAILGTLWVFSNRTSKKIEPEELQILELVVGRIAAELQLERGRIAA